MQCVAITAYKGIKELDSLLEAIHGQMRCLVHIDKKNEGEFIPLLSKYSDVQFFSEYSVNWGGMST